MERAYDERKFTKESTTYSVKTFRRVIHNPTKTYVKKTGFFTNSWRIKIALESHFEEHAQDVRERNWMNPEMQTTWLNTYPPKLIA